MFQSKIVRLSVLKLPEAEPPSLNVTSVKVQSTIGEADAELTKPNSIAASPSGRIFFSKSFSSKS
jgi:hypothetical protein